MKKLGRPIKYKNKPYRVCLLIPSELYGELKNYLLERAPKRRLITEFIQRAIGTQLLMEKSGVIQTPEYKTKRQIRAEQAKLKS